MYASEQMVKDIVDFFWKELHDSVREMKSHRIFMSNFGTFAIRPNKAQEFKERMEKIIAGSNPDTMQKHAILEENKERLRLVNNLLAMVEEDLVKRTEIKTIRNDRYIRDMEEKRKDSGGN